MDRLQGRLILTFNGKLQAKAGLTFRLGYSMKFTSRRTAIFGSIGLLVGSPLLGWTNGTQAAPPQDIEERKGLVWFFGTVEQVVDGVALIDLGEVHALRQGSRLASIRYRDNHFAPLGILEVHASHPTWCQTDKPASFTPEVGDLVISVEAPGDLGDGDAIRDGFIRHRIVTNANGNRYSTMRDTIEADTLQRVVEKQAGWVKAKRRLAGVIRSPSVTTEMYTRLKPFMKQIYLFQDYEDLGVDVAQVIPEAWHDVLERLRYRKQSTDTKTPVGDPEASVQPIETEHAVNPSQLVAVRRVVSETMFQRFPEEQHTIAVICAALLYTKTSNESQWIAQQFAQSQFPRLSDQEQTLIDVEAIMRRVRKTE